MRAGGEGREEDDECCDILNKSWLMSSNVEKMFRLLESWSWPFVFGVMYTCITTLPTIPYHGSSPGCRERRLCPSVV